MGVHAVYVDMVRGKLRKCVRGYSLYEAKGLLLLLMLQWPNYAVILRAVEPRLGRVHGSGQTTCVDVSRRFNV
jgi:hypothetical protein